MATALSDEQIAEIAGAHRIPYEVLYGLIGVESANDTDHLSRFEPRIAEELGIDTTTALRWLATSVGPAHIMGRNLRAMGYRDSIALLAEPGAALLATEYGARWLRRLHEDVMTDIRIGDVRIRETSDPWELAINRYNVGTDVWQPEHMARYRRWCERAVQPGTVLPALALIVTLVGAAIYAG